MRYISSCLKDEKKDSMTPLSYGVLGFEKDCVTFFSIYAHYPQYKDDIEFNISLTYSIYGGYYAYNQYCKCGDERVTGIIGEISERVMMQQTKNI